MVLVKWKWLWWWLWWRRSWNDIIMMITAMVMIVKLRWWLWWWWRWNDNGYHDINDNVDVSVVGSVIVNEVHNPRLPVRSMVRFAARADFKAFVSRWSFLTHWQRSPADVECVEPIGASIKRFGKTTIQRISFSGLQSAYKGT